MSLHSIDLHHVHYHDVVDEWKILFLDNEHNPFNEDKLLSLKPKLEHDIRNISFDEEGGTYCTIYNTFNTRHFYQMASIF